MLNNVLFNTSGHMIKFYFFTKIFKKNKEGGHRDRFRQNKGKMLSETLNKIVTDGTIDVVRVLNINI